MKDRDMTLGIRHAESAGWSAAAGMARHASLALALLAALVAWVTPAWAQPKPVEPYYIVVMQDQTPLLAGAVETHYRVGTLKGGQILRVDFEQDNWSLVAYPAGAIAYVRASEVTPSSDGSLVRTTVPTRLRAANMDSTGQGSWATLLADPLQPLPAGTELRVLGVENRADGSPQFYKVEAPRQARGYLRGGQFRRATPAEAQDHLNRLALEGGTPASSASQADGAATPTPEAEGIAPSVVEAATPASEVVQPTGAGTPGVDGSLLASPVIPAAGDQPVTPAAPIVIDQAGTISGGPTEGAALPQTDPVVLSIESLEAAFDEIRALPVKEAEYEELIARFDAMINTLGDSRDDLRVKRGLQARADLLRLRMEYRDSLRALDEGVRDAQALAQRAAERIDWLRTQGGYAVIGRLVPSSIYDGSSGPLMYRVVAVNTDTPRTLAYVRMDDAFTLPTLVGKVVGVRGMVTIEPSIGTRIVQAESVDEVSVSN